MAGCEGSSCRHNNLFSSNVLKLLYIAINQQKIVLLAVFSLLYSIILFYMLAESAWKKQNSVLSEEANNLSTLKKQITKQSEIDATVQTSISHKINSLKEHAAALAKKLQNEKHKNAQLEFIIKNMRKGQGEPNSSREGEDGIPQLQNRVKKLEYDLGQLNSKANRMAEWVQEKRHLITQNRMERVIDSGIFRNIEIQLIDAELRFKKLLLEKVVRQKEYEKEVKHYAELKQEAQNYVPGKEKKEGKQQKSKPKEKKRDKSKESTTIEVLVQRKTYPSKKYTLLNNNRKSIRPGSISFIDDEVQYENQHKSLIIRKLLIETGLTNQQQLIQHFFNIDELTERVYNKMNLTITQCNQIQEYLESTNLRKNQKKIEFYEKQKKVDKNQTLKAQLQKTKTAIRVLEQQIQAQTQQINAFFTQTRLQELMGKLLPAQQYIPDLTEPQFSQFQSQLQAFQKNILQLLKKKQQKSMASLQTGVSDRSKSNERLQQLIIKAKRSDQILKVMKREDFQEQYHKIVKNSSKHNLLRKEAKRKSNASMRR